MTHLLGCAATLLGLGLLATLIISFVTISIIRLNKDTSSGGIIWE